MIPTADIAQQFHPAEIPAKQKQNPNRAKCAGNFSNMSARKALPAAGAGRAYGEIVY